METISKTTIWSDNANKFDAITRELKFKRLSISREPGKIHTKYYADEGPHDEIEELSVKHPEMTFFAANSFEHESCDSIYIIEYTNGTALFADVKANYWWNYDNTPNVIIPCRDVLEKKLICAFKRMDVLKADPIGTGKHIDWLDAEVTVAVEHKGYRMQATKTLHKIDDIKFFKAHKIEKAEYHLIDENCPF